MLLWLTVLTLLSINLLLRRCLIFFISLNFIVTNHVFEIILQRRKFIFQVFIWNIFLFLSFFVQKVIILSSNCEISSSSWLINDLYVSLITRSENFLSKINFLAFFRKLIITELFIHGLNLYLG